MSFLVDTDTCSAHLKKKGKVTQRFLQYLGRLYASVVTVGELYTWALRSKAPPRRLQDLQGFLNDVQVLDVTEAVAHKFGEVRAALFDNGKAVPEMDLLIAATALVHNLVVVTHNQQDYVNVPGLTLDDWLVP